MISIISIILDLTVYKFINTKSIFLSFFTVLSILFIKRDEKYYIKVFLIGVLYDLIFTNYIILHGFIFLLFGIIINSYYKKFKSSFINNIILGIILIILYQFLLFIIFNVTKVNIIDFNEAIFIGKHFIILNLIYIFMISLLKRVINK